MSKFTKIADLTTEVRANIEAALKDGTLGQAAIAEQFDCAKGVVRMVALQLKAAVVEEEVKVEEVATTEATEEATDAETTEAPVAQTKKDKLAALKAQVGEQDVATTTTDKPKTKRAKAAPVDTTTRDVIVASSKSANVAWMSGNIGYKGKDDAWVTGDLLKTAKGRKGDAALNLAALAEADDLVIERNEAVLVEEHEAVMAGHWDRLEGEAYSMIGRRPKGFKRAPAPRAKKEKAEPQTDSEIDDQIAALMAAKAAKAAKADAVESVEETVTDVVESSEEATTEEAVEA